MVNSVELFKSLEKKLMSTNIEMINEAWNLSNETLQLSKSNPKDCWMKLWDKPLYHGQTNHKKICYNYILRDKEKRVVRWILRDNKF